MAVRKPIVNVSGTLTELPTGDTIALDNATVIAKVLTGFTSGSGTVSATDSLLSAAQKLDGNTALKAPIASPVFTGSMGLGSTPAAGKFVELNANFTGSTTEYGFSTASLIASDVTSMVRGYHTNLSTQASAFTLSNLQHFIATQGTIGAGSAVTTQYGFIAASSLVGAATNYGFYGNIPAATGCWNFYAAGSADNYFGGNIGIGVTTPSNDLSFGGDVARNIGSERATTANTAGNFLRLIAGGASIGATDKAGGSAVIRGGISTGTGQSVVSLQTYGDGTGSGTADKSIQTMVQASGNKLGFYGVTPVARAAATTAAVANAPAGGTGTAAGGWDTAAHRDTAIAAINNLMTRVAQLETIITNIGISL